MHRLNYFSFKFFNIGVRTRSLNKSDYLKLKLF